MKSSENKAASSPLSVTAGFGDFERNAVASAHYAAAQRHDKLASDRREWAKERGPIWQRYLAQALRCERKARQHRERAREIFASPNTTVRHGAPEPSTPDGQSSPLSLPPC